MNIGINARVVLPGVQEGIAKYTLEIANKLALHHPDISFHVYFDRAFNASLLTQPNMKGHVVIPQARHPLLWKIWFNYTLPYAMHRDNIDVWLSPDGYTSLTCSIPSVMVTHDLAFEHFDDQNLPHHLRYLKTFTRQFHQKADHIIAVSHATKNDIEQTYHIHPSKISVAGNSTTIAPKTLNSELFGEDIPYFIYVGSMHPRKNIIRMIEAFEMFRKIYDRTMHLVLVGRYAWRSEEIRRRIEKSESRSHIIHLTANEDEKAQLITHAKALLYVSVFEGFGIPILEGWGCEVPVITANLSSMKEIGGHAALMVNPYDVEEICTAMNEALQPNIRQQLKETGKKNLQEYSWEKSAAIIFEALMQVYENRKK